jgi:hypothetical protein
VYLFRQEDVRFEATAQMHRPGRYAVLIRHDLDQ